MEIPNKIWVESQTLSNYIRGHFKERYESALDQKVLLAQRLTGGKERFYGPLDKQPPLLDSIAYMLEDAAPEEATFELFQVLLPKIQKGEILIIGLKKDDGDSAPQIIPRNFWLRAVTQRNLEAASTAEADYSHLKVLEHESSVTVHQNPISYAGEALDDQTSDSNHPFGKGGRPNTKSTAKERIRDLLSHDPKFVGLANRTEQARYLRAVIAGDRYRQDDDFPGMKTDTIKRWIGEVVNEKRGTA